MKDFQKVRLRYVHEFEQADQALMDAITRTDSHEGASIRNDVDLDKQINDFYTSLGSTGLGDDDDAEPNAGDEVH